VRRDEDDADQMIGQDSFLDVVTNIVGILILLVMVVGMRASHAVETAVITQRASEVAQQNVTPDDVRQAVESAADAERQVRELIYRVVDTRQETLLREKEREVLSTMVAEAEQHIAERRERLDSQQRRDFDVRRQLAEAQLTLDELTREQVAMLSQEPDVEEIKCEPTPLAQVVTGKEVHVLLADDHVAVVPFDALLEQMKADIQENVWRLREQDELERTVGPTGGFRLRYWFVKTDVIARSEAGTVVAGRVPQFSHCFFVPERTPAGEPALESLRANSELRQFLQRLNPPATTVTIWTYPGNYERLREIKRTIRDLGFQIAVRPLPKGMPIGASRTGSESLSE
jgi:hypothetical protein